MAASLTRSSYRQMTEDYHLDLCTSHLSCPEHLSRYRHEHGYADRWGMIHWAWPDIRVQKRGLRTYLKLVAAVRMRHHSRGTPTWQALYETNTWAEKEAERTYRVRLPRRYSRTDRARTKQLAARRDIRLRKSYPSIYQWTREGER